MAGSSSTKGFQCQFLDPIPEDYYCKQCTLVARKLSFSSCCGESYCNGCISPIKQANKPCPNPECGEDDFDISQQVKYQRKILSLQVYCMKKEKGCGWQGKLEELDAHLDPDKGNCEYIDIKCPLKCDQKVAKKNITEHVANECVQRDFICPYCAFKDTYEIVTTVHYPECSYYPLPCPNRCGVTCERPTMEDHRKICPLEVVECEFKHVGCEMKFVRDEKEEHMREKSQTHLTMMAISLARMQEGFQQLLLEKEKSFEEKLKAQEEKFEKEREKQKKDLDEKLKAQEERFETERKQQEKEAVEKLREQEKKLMTQVESSCGQWKETMEGKVETNTKELEKIRRFYCLHREVILSIDPIMPRSIINIARALFISPDKPYERQYKEKLSLSPAIYTHLYGYKFCIGIVTKGYEHEQWDKASLSAFAMIGEFDDLLKWPVKAEFTMELINHFENGENRMDTMTMQWNKVKIEEECPKPFPQDINFIQTFYTIKHSEVDCNPTQKTHFLKNNTLHFRILDVNIAT